ncbi:DNA-binding transcriptional regulator, XRE-family HTH domain [Pedobacter sp. ok626]|uniref:helix-turn-helix domain-containing protein n=1 Tax=Pedobacter sp. ok626 TaxID=1761882 RepID=UPI000888F2E8|nr:helix-turn-helix transcriptional regulator [Pedobacter sp. ok626]SDJ79784.1 DNA-binding transcriptional regulator, XRE-family HTH domain [Pedobacter sp. ok626]
MNTSDLELLKGKLGERIKGLREKSELSIRQFALLADIEHPQLINIEKGRVDLKLSTLNKIAKAFGMDLMGLFDFSEINAKK